ncbi:hypothetical protein STEG23_001810 [Scotinomys teguina]
MEKRKRETGMKDRRDGDRQNETRKKKAKTRMEIGVSEFEITKEVIVEDDDDDEKEEEEEEDDDDDDEGVLSRCHTVVITVATDFKHYNGEIGKWHQVVMDWDLLHCQLFLLEIDSSD